MLFTFLLAPNFNFSIALDPAFFTGFVHRKFCILWFSVMIRQDHPKFPSSRFLHFEEDEEEFARNPVQGFDVVWQCDKFSIRLGKRFHCQTKLWICKTEACFRVRYWAWVFWVLFSSHDTVLERLIECRCTILINLAEKLTKDALLISEAKVEQGFHWACLKFAGPIALKFWSLLQGTTLTFQEGPLQSQTPFCQNSSRQNIDLQLQKANASLDSFDSKSARKSLFGCSTYIFETHTLKRQNSFFRLWEILLQSISFHPSWIFSSKFSIICKQGLIKGHGATILQPDKVGLWWVSP